MPSWSSSSFRYPLSIPFSENSPVTLGLVSMSQCGSRASRSSMFYKCSLNFSLLQGKESFSLQELFSTVLSPLLTQSQCSVNARHLTSHYDDTQPKVVMMRARRGHTPGPRSLLKLSLVQDTYGGRVSLGLLLPLDHISNLQAHSFGF